MELYMGLCRDYIWGCTGIIYGVGFKFWSWGTLATPTPKISNS